MGPSRRSRAYASEARPAEARPGTDPGEAAAVEAFEIEAEDRYDEVAELGRGGMGTVVAAVDRRLGRQVALKRVTGGPADPEAAARFAREAAITASLDHPAIVPVFDAGVGADGALFYTMRMIRGRTLGAAIADAGAGAAPRRLVRWFLGACEAVAYAHSQGVIHRDLKPDNILIAGFGDVQVVDWGVAARVGEPAAARAGTPAYMSPEQAAGAAPDPRADVWSLGAVLFELAAGRARADDPRLPRATPRELAAIVERALAEVPAARYPDAGALAADLAAYLDGRPVAAYRYTAADALGRWARRRRGALAVAAGASVVLLVAGAAALVRMRAERDRARAAERGALLARDEAAVSLGRTLVEQAITALTADAQAEAEVLAAEALVRVESPEARGVLAASSRAGRPRLRARVAVPGCDVIEPGPGDALLCLAGDRLRVLDGTPPRVRWEAARSVRGVAWVGDRVAVTDDEPRIRLLAGDDGRPLADLGRGIASMTFEPGDGGALVASAAGALLSVIDGERALVHHARPCTDHGGHVSARAGHGRVAVVCRDRTVLVTDREARPFAAVRIPTTDGADLAAAALTPDGARLIVASMTGELVTADVATGAIVAARRTALGVVRTFAFSPDARRVALVGDRGGVSIWDPEAWVLHRRLPAGRDQAVRWSADGRALTTAGPAIRRWDLAPDEPALRITAAAPPGLAGADLSPDGARLILAAGDGTVQVIDARDGRRRFADRFQDGVVKGARFTRDGGVLAWTAGTPSLRRYGEDGRVLETRGTHGLKRAAQMPSGALVLAPYDLRLELHAGGRVEHHGDHPILDLDQTVDGRELVALDTTGGLWRITDGAVPTVERLAVHAGAIAVAVAGDGQTLAVIDRDAITILDRAGAPRAALPGGGRRLLDVALSPDGTRVAAGDLDRRARVWSVAGARLLAVLVGHEARVATVRFSADGATLVTASWDGAARLWDLRALERPAEALRAEIERAWGVGLDEAGAAPLR